MREMLILRLLTSTLEIEIYETNLHYYGETLYIIRGRELRNNMLHTRFGNKTQMLSIVRTYRNTKVDYVCEDRKEMVEFVKNCRGLFL
jgi:hypothetical protein